jgi:hypothetical protein
MYPPGDLPKFLASQGVAPQIPEGAVSQAVGASTAGVTPAAPSIAKAQQ